MNFQSLRTLVDNLVQTYLCPGCESSVEDKHVEVVGTAGSCLNVEVNCPDCKKHTLIRAQMVSLEIPAENIDQQKLQDLHSKLQTIQGKQKTIENLQGTLSQAKKPDSIKDNLIIDLNKKLKEKNIGVESIFGTLSDDSESEKK